MKNDILSEFLGDPDFLQFVIEQKELHVDTDDLGITLTHLQENPNNQGAKKFIFMIPEFTDMLLDALANYRSHDILDRILHVLPHDKIVHTLGNAIDIYTTPTDFTSIFYGNCPHGLQSLSVLGDQLSNILKQWNNMPIGTALGIYYSVNLLHGGLVIDVRIGSTTPAPDAKGYSYFSPSKSLYSVDLDRNATFAYLDYAYPDKTLFDIFGVSFDTVMMAKYGG